jgi:methyltransferase
MGEGAFLIAFIVVQRLAELLWARRNAARLLSAGGVEFGRSHYPWIGALHATWLTALWLFGRDRAIDPFLLVVFILLQVGRVWVFASLGRRWTTRVIVLPGERLVASGPYRWLRHPNYVVVALEIAIVPLALGLPALAFIFTLLNAVVLYQRIRVENAALAQAADSRAKGQTLANET